MDPLDFLTDEQLLRFFRCSRTEMSCMEQPHTFLNQLRDHHLIPEEMYKKLIRCRSKELREKGVYQVLDWVEAERPDSIKVFWNCVFRDHLLQQYPTLRLLRNRLLEGSFTFYEKLPEKVEKEEEEEDKKKKGSAEGEEEEEEKKTRRKKRNQEKRSESAKEEQPSTSTQSNPSQKRKVQRPKYSSPFSKKEKDDIWTWPFYKTQLPVTCGDKEGMLNRDKLAKGERCILVQGRWFIPSGFEEFGGKKSSKNWKYSIRCRGTTLGKLIQEGHLTSPDFKRRKSAQAKRALFPSNQSAGSITESKQDDVDEEEEEAEWEVFKVTCGAKNGMLHNNRFASGTNFVLRRFNKQHSIAIVMSLKLLKVLETLLHVGNPLSLAAPQILPPRSAFIKQKTHFSRSTRSAMRGDCIVPFRKSTFSQTAFTLRVSHVWNSLPSDTRNCATHNLSVVSEVCR
uniref:SP110 nuclear antigen, tandem duplicate 1 n=1 Tax=Salmo trutta TaxID=8032 RepID=A0A673YKD7_SALTR